MNNVCDMDYMDYINIRDMDLVRRYCRTKFAKYEKYTNVKSEVKLSHEEYLICKNAFECGVTHADDFKK